MRSDTLCNLLHLPCVCEIQGDKLSSQQTTGISICTSRHPRRNRIIGHGGHLTTESKSHVCRRAGASLLLSFLFLPIFRFLVLLHSSPLFAAFCKLLLMLCGTFHMFGSGSKLMVGVSEVLVPLVTSQRSDFYHCMIQQNTH